MARKRVTKEAIEAARVEFVRQLREWEDRDDVNDDDDEDNHIRVEIARGVTPAMVKRIPDDWLVGLVVALRTDNYVLELMDVEGKEHNSACCAAIQTLAEYAGRNGFVALRSFPYDYDYNGRTYRPDGRLETSDNPPAPVLVLEVEVDYRSVRELIVAATDYLQRTTIQRVVGFKIFCAQPKTKSRDCNLLLKKPALAVVFERVPQQSAPPFAIQIAHEVSFGTAAIPNNVMDALRVLPTRTGGPHHRRCVPASPYEHVAISAYDPRGGFPQMAAHTLDVDVPGSHALVLDLRHIFQAAALGWKNDHWDSRNY